MSQRITRVLSVVSVSSVVSVGLGLAVLIAGFAVTGCDSQEDTYGGVDQPGPVDWQTQGGALMTAPSKSPRTIAAMMFDISGAGGTTASGAPNATTIMNVIGGTGTSQRHMFEEISYGIQDTQPMYF